MRRTRMREAYRSPIKALKALLGKGIDMRVLLADTDEVFLEIVQGFLWDRGHEAEIATDALECISILREFVPAALVIDRDLLWGGTDGVLELLAKDPLFANLATILTADGRIDDELHAHASWPVACLAKPYRLGELLSHLNKARRSQLSLLSPAESM